MATTLFTNNITFEGSTSDTNQTTLSVANPTADRTITLPNATGTLALTSTIPTTITVADTSDTTAFVALFESDTGDLAPKTDAAITYNAGTGALTASSFVGNVTGSAATLATPRTIGGTSFDGSANIAVALSATATALASARTIGGTSFDGTANIAVALSATATALASARTIGGTSFNGTADIVPGTITVADTTDTTSYVALFESATGDLAPKTDAAITYNAQTGALTATSFVGALTGNAATATQISGITNSNIVQLADTQTLENKTLTVPQINNGVTGSAIKDEDNMASNSATHLCTQQSIKAYVDASGGATQLNGLSDTLIEDSSLYIGPTASGMSQTDTASYNIGVGVTALDAVTTGDHNTVIGYDAGTALTTGSDNTIIGFDAGKTTVVGLGLVIIGSGAGAAAMTAAADGTIAIGQGAGAAITVGEGNVAIGKFALNLNVDGDKNTAVGYQALQSMEPTLASTGNNTSIGYNSGKSITTGLNNTLLGSEAGRILSLISSGTSGVGGFAGVSGTANIRLEFGSSEVDDAYNGLKIEIASVVHTGVGSPSTITAIISDYVGATRIATLGGGGSSITTVADTTTAVTISAAPDGKSYEIKSINLTTGGNNSFIGYGSGGNGTASNQTSLGYQAGCFAANQITLGNPRVTALRCADATIATLSDQRDKTNIVDSSYGLSFINTLRPVQYTWDRRDLELGDSTSVLNGKTRVGFIAQELHAAMPNNENNVLDLVYDVNPNRLEAKYGNLIPILTKAIQDLSAANDALTARVAALESA